MVTGKGKADLTARIDQSVTPLSNIIQEIIKTQNLSLYDNLDTIKGEKKTSDETTCC